jgi:PAS domain S-box-containing protein
MRGYESKTVALIFLTGFVCLTLLGVYSFVEYFEQKNSILSNIDLRLYNNAIALKYILPEDYHDRAIDEDAISIEEDRSNVNKFKDYVKDVGIKYAYTVIKRNERLFFIVTEGLIEPEKADSKRGRVTYYFYDYTEEADKSFFEAFDVSTPTYQTVSDHWGKVRTVMVPQISPGGTKYLACADYGINYVNDLLNRNSLKLAGITSLLLFLVFPFMVLFKKLSVEHVKKIKKSEELYRSLFEDNPSMYFKMDSDGIVLSVNAFGAEQLGYTVDEIVGRSVLDVFYPDDKKEVLRRFLKILETPGKVANWRFRKVKKNGSVIWVEENVRSIQEADDSKTVLVVCDDVTEKIEMEEKISENEKKYRLITESVADLIWTMDMNFNTTYLSPSIFQQRGYTVKEGMELCFEERMTPSSLKKSLKLFAKKIEQIESNDQKGFDYIQFETQQYCKDGSVIWTNNNVRILPGKNGKPQSIIGVSRDITRKKEMEAQLQQSQKMEAIGTLAGGIAHDFNNILSGIYGYIQLASMHLDDVGQVKKYLNELNKGAVRASELVQQILTFSRQKESEKIPIKVYLIATEVVKLIRSSIPSTIEIKTEIVSKEAIIGDPVQIHQVIMNLCTNASQSMPDGGTLDIKLLDVEISQSNSLLKDGYFAGKYIKLSIADSGTGMSKEQMEKIFDPYFTTKEVGQGTGLGLAVVDGIIKKNGGFIEVDSTLHKGSIFKIYWPIVKNSIPCQIFQDR